MSTQMKGIFDPLLTDASSAYKPKGMLADLLFPALKFAQYTGKLGAYGKSFLRIENNVVGGKGMYRRVNSIVYSTSSFEIEGHGLTDIVTKRDYANVVAPFKAEDDKQMGITTMLQLEKEFGLASQLANTSVITQNVTLSGTSQFSDRTNSDPVSVILTGKKAVRDGCGEVANAAIMDFDVAEQLRYHPQLLDMLGFKEQKPGGLTDADLARAFNLKKIFIAEAKYNSAKEGQTDVLANVWGKHIVLAVIPDRAEQMQVSLGYNIRLDGQAPRKVYKQALFNPPGSTELLVEDEYDLLIANAAAAYLIKDAIA